MVSRFQSAKLASSAILGVFLLIVSVAFFSERLAFFKDAKPFTATIVEVERQEIKKKKWWAIGRVPVMTYTPIVEIPDADGESVKVEVDASSEEDEYRVGSKMDVLYNKYGDIALHQCVPNTFWGKWGRIIPISSISLLLLSPLLLRSFYRKRRRDNYKRRPVALTVSSHKPAVFKRRRHKPKRRFKKS